MEEKKTFISPMKLYPTESFVFIKDAILQSYLTRFKNEEEVEKPIVFLFYENYYILKGHHIVLAAILAGKKEISVEIIDTKDIPFWKDEENVKYTLKSVGKSTLYDFEAIGNFTYSLYPSFYEKDC